MTNYTSYYKIEGALKVGYLYVGRINVTTSTGIFQQIGKIYAGFIYYRHPESGQEIIYGGPYEILACNTCPYQKAADEPCCTNGGRGKFCCTVSVIKMTEILHFHNFQIFFKRMVQITKTAA